MTIERLDFDAAAPLPSIELAIHTARYAVAAPLARGAAVLDVACGHGYGSFLFRERWGAQSVVGLDISEDSIGVANARFGAEGIEFRVGDAEELDEMFEAGRFDVAVSFETVEHLRNPERFLRALRTVVKPGGAIVLSCPNDHWYYPNASSGNPFHRAKYRLDEFLALCEPSLGRPSVVLLGTKVYGYANVAVDGSSTHPVASTMGRTGIEGIESLAALRIPNDAAITAENCAYFVAAFGVERDSLVPAGLCAYPVPMNDSVVGLSAEVDRLRAELESRPSAAEFRRVSLGLAGTRAELELLRASALALAASGGPLAPYIASLKATIADQTRLIDERDAYIVELEERAERLEEELRAQPFADLAKLPKRVARFRRSLVSRVKDWRKGS